MPLDYDERPREEPMMDKKHALAAFENPAFINSPEARSLRILSEYIEPQSRFDCLKVNTTVLFLGSARIDPEAEQSPLCRYYWEAEELAYRITRWAIPLRPKGKNFVVCTGAGPGIMEAANRGAVRAGGKTIGMNIALPHEQTANKYVSPELAFQFHYFFMRKFWLISRARAVIAFPGGFGTLDEFFETMTLIQTGKISRRDVVVVLYGEEYWRNILNLDGLVKAGAIEARDLGSFRFLSDPKKAFAYLKKELNEFLVGDAGAPLPAGLR
jgi:uncharacterized protein (TIGR00730 family)